MTHAHKHQENAAPSESLRIAQEHIDRLRALGRPVLCFCVFRDFRLPDEYFREIWRTVEDGFSLLTVGNADPAAFSMPGDVLPLEPEDVASLRGVRVFCVTDQYRHAYPAESLVVAFPHSFMGYDRPLSLSSWKWKIGTYDAYVTTTPQTWLDADLLRTTLDSRCPPQWIRRRSPRFLFIPAGCPRVAAVRAALRRYDGPVDSLMYAPTGLWGNPRDRQNESVLNYGGKVIGDLLEGFPDRRIVFRADIADRERPHIRDILEAHGGHPRFAVSWETDHAPEFVRCAALVTDYSNIGEVFAFGTLRPEIRVTMEGDPGRLALHRSGLETHPAGDVAAAVRHALDMPAEHWERHISAAFDGYTYDPETVFGRIRDALLDLAAGTVPRRAVTIARDGGAPAWGRGDFLKAICDGGDVELVEGYLEEFPDDPFALQMQLLILRDRCPNHLIARGHELAEDARRRLEEWTGWSIGDHTFAEIPDEAYLALLRQAVLLGGRLRDVRYLAILEEWGSGLGDLLRGR